jgi:ATP-dependent Lon protease
MKEVVELALLNEKVSNALDLTVKEKEAKPVLS